MSAQTMQTLFVSRDPNIEASAYKQSLLLHHYIARWRWLMSRLYSEIKLQLNNKGTIKS